MNEPKTEILHPSSGVLKYFIGPNGGYKLIVESDQDIMKFYRFLIPKYIQTNVPMYKAHISVVRKEVPPNLEFWGKYEGEEVEFVYSPIVHFGEVYCWLNCFCNRLEQIRIELGLPCDSRFTLPPEGFTRCFHMTIGNFKSNQ